MITYIKPYSLHRKNINRDNETKNDIPTDFLQILITFWVESGNNCSNPEYPKVTRLICFIFFIII